MPFIAIISKLFNPWLLLLITMLVSVFNYSSLVQERNNAEAKAILAISKFDVAAEFNDSLIKSVDRLSQHNVELQAAYIEREKFDGTAVANLNKVASDLEGMFDVDEKTCDSVPYSAAYIERMQQFYRAQGVNADSDRVHVPASG